MSTPMHLRRTFKPEWIKQFCWISNCSRMVVMGNSWSQTSSENYPKFLWIRWPKSPICCLLSAVLPSRSLFEPGDPQGAGAIHPVDMGALLVFRHPRPAAKGPRRSRCSRALKPKKDWREILSAPACSPTHSTAPRSTQPRARPPAAAAPSSTAPREVPRIRARHSGRASGARRAARRGVTRGGR